MSGDGEHRSPSSTSELRRATAIVLLGLLIFVVLGNFIDDEFFGDRYTPDPNFLFLVGGMVTALFGGDIVARLRGDR